MQRLAVLLVILCLVVLAIAKDERASLRHRALEYYDSDDMEDGYSPKAGKGKGKNKGKGKKGGKSKKTGKGKKKGKGKKNKMKGKKKKGKGGKGKGGIAGYDEPIIIDDPIPDPPPTPPVDDQSPQEPYPQQPPDSPRTEPPGPRFARDPNDLGMRFSKIVFPAGMPSEGHLPLDADDYPISPNTASWLRESIVVSLVVDAECFQCPMPIADAIDRLGGLPTYPSKDPDDPFWDELMHVTWVQHQRSYGVDPHILLPLPSQWDHMTVDEVAEAVHDEMPGSHHTVLLERFLAEGVQADPMIIPKRSGTEFLRGVVMWADLNTWAPAMVGPTNFGVKFFAGRPRPEEVAWEIAQGTLTEADGVPGDLVELIRIMQLDSPEKFTAYPEGCPMHPSWPAMHSAASVGSLWMSVTMDLTPEQSCQAKILDYAIAYARTVAGVHYPTDNYAGLQLGQDLIAGYLPTFLEERYGSDPQLVQEKIDRVRFDWTDFPASHCARFGVDPPMLDA